MPIRRITDPVETPLSLAEIKFNLKLAMTLAEAQVAHDEDGAIEGFLRAAVDYVEQYTGRALLLQTLEKTIDAFPEAEIELPRPPILAVDSVRYRDPLGQWQTLAASAYALDQDSEPGWLLPALGLDWPDTLASANAVRVRYRAGYDSAAKVPASIKQALHLLVGHWYEVRQAVTVGAHTAQAVPFGVEALLAPYRLTLAFV